MSHFLYPTPPLRRDVICLIGVDMAARDEMTDEEVHVYLEDHSEYDGRGERPDGDYDDGDGKTEQVKAQ